MDTLHWDFTNDMGRVCGSSELRSDEDPEDTLRRMNERFGARSHWLNGDPPKVAAVPVKASGKRVAARDYDAGFRDGRRYEAKRLAVLTPSPQ